MNKEKVQSILINQLKFSLDQVKKLDMYHNELINYNKNYNLISNSTIDDIWNRHILDSAQLVKYIKFENNKSLSDMGSGAGLPGLILAIFNNNPKFHVKLYEKSKIKCNFLNLVIKKLKIDSKVYNGHYSTHNIDSEYIVSRAFKKLEETIRISREIVRVNHTLVILKGKKAQLEVNSLQPPLNYVYILKNSMTNIESKILIIDIKKNK